MTRIACDIDGVLAPSGKGNILERDWTKIEPQMIINEPFFAITARPNIPEFLTVTCEWLIRTQPNFVNVYMYEAGVGKVPAFKADVLNRGPAILVYIDDDLDQLLEIKRLLRRNVYLFHYVGGENRLLKNANKDPYELAIVIEIMNNIKKPLHFN